MSLPRVATFLTVLFLFFASPGIATPVTVAVDDSAAIQTNNTTRQEVFLSFNYRNLFDKVIIAYYENGEYYLPVSELFSTLKIANEVNPSDLSLEGFFLEPENRFRFDFQKDNFRVSLQNKGTFQFDGSQMLIRELDYYVQINVLAEVFDLNFSIDINNLLLQLNTPHTLPIVAEQERAKRRRSQQNLNINRDYHPLQYDRERTLLGGAFLDYSLSANISDLENAYNFNLDLGAEVLGGDLQGSTYGNYSKDFSSFTTNNLRWRYVMRDHPLLTQFYAGQTSSDGLINRNFTGFKLTNEPIEPRFLYDSYQIQGRAAPGSEVELYYNNALYDFRRISEDEQYRFLAPLTYGTSRLKLRIYGPDGRITEREERIRIPFSFLPQGEFSYHLNAGRLDNAIFGTNQQSNIVQGDVAYGLSNTITQKVGVEYFNEFTDQSPLLYSSTSARLFDNYLFSMDLAPGAFYRLSGNVIYSGSASWGLDYTYYTDDGIYNILGYDQEISGNFFIPFQISRIPFNIRFIGDYAINEPGDNISYNIDLNSRISRLNLRLSYRDRQVGDFMLNPSVTSELSASATYLISNNDDIPRYLQNTFVSGRIDYNPGISSFEQAQLKLSRSVFEIGRLQASVSRNFIGDFNFVNVGLTLDFNAFRSTSTVRNTSNQTIFTQNVRGSIGYDDYNREVLFTNRPQVGRSATSLRLFIDANNSGDYDEGEQIIEDEAVRIGRAGVSSSTGEGIQRFTQLQAYHQVNMEINQGAIKNPLLVPSMEQFSIVTDPNQYKPINVPFYVSGVIEGKVVRAMPDAERPLSGIRVLLKGKGNDFEKEMQTFSDGSYYAYEVPPGIYTLEIDSTQLQFLDAVSEPDVLEFEVEALAEGDFKDQLNFKILPKEGFPAQADKPKEKTPLPETPKKAEGPDTFYQVQLASYAGINWARLSDRNAEQLFAEQFFIRYNPVANLFALRSTPFKAKEKAMESILSFRESIFDEPALVISQDSSYSSEDLIPIFTIQIGPFVTEEAARAYGNQLEVPVAIKPLVDNEGYSLWTGQYQSREEALKELKQPLHQEINNITASIVQINSSPIPDLHFGFGIEFTGLSRDEVHRLMDSLQKNDFLPEAAAIDTTDNRLVIRNMPSWRETVNLKRKLENNFKMGVPVLVLWQEEI